MDIFDIAGGNMTDSYFQSNGNNNYKADEKESKRLPEIIERAGSMYTIYKEGESEREIE